jgi:hypothetical protein
MNPVVASLAWKTALAAALVMSAHETSTPVRSCEPLPCGTSLRAWDPEHRLNQYSIIHVVSVRPHSASTPTVPCGEPMGPRHTLKVVTYRDWRGSCQSAGPEEHLLYGNVCFSDVRSWPQCCATLIVEAEGSGDCLRLDFLNNCVCPDPE